MLRQRDEGKDGQAYQFRQARLCHLGEHGVSENDSTLLNNVNGFPGVLHHKAVFQLRLPQCLFRTAPLCYFCGQGGIGGRQLLRAIEDPAFQLGIGLAERVLGVLSFTEPPFELGCHVVKGQSEPADFIRSVRQACPYVHLAPCKTSR